MLFYGISIIQFLNNMAGMREKEAAEGAKQFMCWKGDADRRSKQQGMSTSIGCFYIHCLVTGWGSALKLNIVKKAVFFSMLSLNRLFILERQSDNVTLSNSCNQRMLYTLWEIAKHSLNGTRAKQAISYVQIPAFSTRCHHHPCPFPYRADVTWGAVS